MKNRLALSGVIYLILLLGASPANVFSQSEDIAPKVPPTDWSGSLWEPSPENPPIREGYTLVGDLILPVTPDDSISPQGIVDAYLWEDGIVPYAFDAGVSSGERSNALNAMAVWEAVSDVDFVARTNQSGYIKFFDCNGNSSFVGFVGGEQEVCILNWNIQSVIVHELGHALGLYHEHNRPDRNNYVTINTGNIPGGAQSQFAITINLSTMVGDYDFDSVMHYDRFAFTNNGQPTIETLPAYSQYAFTIGTASGPSAGDIAAIRAFYGGGGITTPTNDTPQGSEIVDSYNYTQESIPALATEDLSMPCVPGVAKTVWYKFTALSAGDISIDTFGSTYDTVMTVWTGTPSNLTVSICVDDSNNTRQSLLTGTLDAGDVIYIQIGSYDDGFFVPQIGRLDFSLTFDPDLNLNDLDINNDGVVSAVDAIYVYNRLGGTNSTADVNADGNVTEADLQLIFDYLGTSLP